MSLEKFVNDNKFKNYMAPSDKEIQMRWRKEMDMLYPANAPPEYANGGLFGIKKLSMEKCRKVAEQCPLFMKGARKKAKDSIRAWHGIETFDNKTKPAAVDLQLINSFVERSNLKSKWGLMQVASYVTGNGYLLLTFSEGDEKTKTHDEPAIGSYPWDVLVLDSELITEIDYYGKTTQEKEINRKKGILHFHYENKKTSEDYWIHPKRIIHLPCDPLPHKKFGTSKVNLLRNIIKSMINVDIACGEVLAWFSHGVFDIEQQGCDENYREAWEKLAAKHPGAWIHDETAKIQAIKPEAINPKPFYDYLVLKVASTFIMPTHILTGIQVGRVTGAEVGTSDYYKDVKDIQDLDYSPLLSKLYSMILNGHKRKWKYQIVWNTIYIDELAEANIMFKKAETIEKLAGYISKREAREIFNKGQIELDPDKIPKNDDTPPPKNPTKPPQRPGNDDSKKNDVYKQQLDAVDKVMIEKRKLQWLKERKIGEDILKKQDEHKN